MAYYILNYQGLLYANSELYIDAISQGDKAFIKALARGKIKAVDILGEVIYNMDGQAYMKACEFLSGGKHQYEKQWITERLQSMRTPSAELLADLEKDHRVVKIESSSVSLRLCGRSFIRVRDFAWQNKYRMLDRMATVQICGTKFIAFNTVIKGEGSPIVMCTRPR